VALFAALVLLGFLSGGLVATRIIGTSGMGWDRLADTLGGLLVGGALGAVAWLVTVRRLDAAGRLRMAGAAVLGGLGVVAYLQATEPRVRPPRAADLPAPAVEPFAVQIGVADGLEPPAGEKLPWSLLRIASNLSLDYVPADRTDLHCIVIDPLNGRRGIEALTQLRAVLVDTPREFDCGEPCPTCMDVSLQWYIGDDQTATTITDRCWRSHPALEPLRASVERLYAEFRDAAECSPSAQ
jgi:hypothetical protein